MSAVRRTKKPKRTHNREELEALDKTELVERILKAEAHNEQLRRIILESDKKSLVNKKHRAFDFSNSPKRHILLKLYYLGWSYEGYVTQETTANTIEHHLFSALIKSCCVESRATSNYHRCGRTDKGVSSFSQVVSLDIRSCLQVEQQSNVNMELPYCKILNRLLPPDIRCIAWSPVPSEFSARFDCKLRSYRYFFPRGDLDVPSMDDAAKLMIGHHDFRNLCKMDVGNGVVDFHRTVLSASVSVLNGKSESESGYDMCEFQITSRAFLWHQIRCLMGILFLVGQRKEKPIIVTELLDIKTCPRKPQYNMASEVPLNLWYCQYDGVEWVIDKEELKRTIKGLQKEWTMNTVKSAMIQCMLSNLENSLPDADLNFQMDCLLLGVESKVYRPLKSRLTCESLEAKITHYEKKGRFEKTKQDS